MINSIKVTENSNDKINELVFPKAYFGRVVNTESTTTGIILNVNVTNLALEYTPSNGDKLVILFDTGLKLGSLGRDRFSISLNNGESKLAKLNQFNCPVVNGAFNVGDFIYDIDSGSCVHFLFLNGQWIATNCMSPVYNKNFYTQTYTDLDLINGSWNGTEYTADSPGIGKLPAYGMMTGNLLCTPDSNIFPFSSTPHTCLGIVGWSAASPHVSLFWKSTVYSTDTSGINPNVTLRVGMYNPNSTALPSDESGNVAFDVGWIC